MEGKLRVLCSVSVVVALHALSAASQVGGTGDWALPTGSPRNAEEHLELLLRTLEALESAPTSSAPSPSPELGAEARRDKGTGGGMPLGGDSSDTPQIVDIRPSSEDGVLIYWQSETDAIYRVECCPDPDLGGIPHVLIEDYPSHGAITYWQDTGDHFSDPEIPHPRETSQRFYRIARTDYNTAIAPVVTITSHSSGEAVSGEIEVEVDVSTDLRLMDVQLFIDGEKYDPDRDERAVFPINTCEWSNGPHTLFAQAEVHSAISVTPVLAPIDIAQGVSSSVDLVFDNYASRFRVSDYFFCPAEGDMQRISAEFEEESAWVLTIVDQDGIPVRSFSGTGTRMDVGWDGTDGDGQPLPYGVYGMEVTAAMPQGGNARAGYPRRRGPWILDPDPGTFGVAYQGHHPPPPPAFAPPSDGAPFRPGPVQLPCIPPLGPGATAKNEALGFSRAMRNRNWKPGFSLGDDALTASALRAPTIFNQVNIGLLIGHGTYGMTDDWNHGTPCKLTYFPVYHSNPMSYEWVRLPQFDFGSDNLRWMALVSCHLLRDQQFQQMLNHHLLPVNQKLHLLLGFETVAPACETFPSQWANLMHGTMGRDPLTIIGAFETAAAQSTYPAGSIPYPGADPEPLYVVRVVGWENCWSDTLTKYQAPSTSGALFWRDYEVNN